MAAVSSHEVFHMSDREVSSNYGLIFCQKEEKRTEWDRSW